ncbi:aspartate kinase [Clostridium sp. D2Q-11]|uniref:Aspartokinase n=1 Tax=Anaeromonas frigoriresistens TaxID=2683708 RepID=A0A942Z7U4_9FIRM|nr:aspartate kinase [Anaeromonas frigoriresistens]MBS4539901.1 aspartate kinase [Anaeromonas frigoriresistens]
MSIIVQKFGGTSVANESSREKVIEKIIEKKNKGHKIVVVVSAIGRKGDPYATDSLISLINTQYINKRDLDLLMSCGEIISSVVLSNMLTQKGYSTQVLTGGQAGIITDENYGSSKVLSVNTDNIKNKLENNNIIIVAGFQGITSQGDITTLGRGGSDTTAVLLGEALKSEFVEIYTDVDGIMTADPRVVPDAQVIDTINYSDLYNMAEDGAKVIHPKAVEIAERSNLKVKIRNTLSSSDGTTVLRRQGIIDYNDKKIISSITYKDRRTQIIIDNIKNKGKIQSVMNLLTESNISIDLINFSLETNMFTIDDENVMLAEKILSENGYIYSINRDCCKISVVGHKMKGIPGVMSRIINSIFRENIKILQTSDSHSSIWVLVKTKDAIKAMRSLHKEFNLGEK